jgi:hypothetical protein
VTPLTRAPGPWLSFASPRRGECARAVLVTLVLLAASPFHAPFSSFDQGQHGHAHAQAASAQKSVQQQTATDLPSLDLSATPFERAAGKPVAAVRGVSGLRTLRLILRL